MKPLPALVDRLPSDCVGQLYSTVQMDTGDFNSRARTMTSTSFWAFFFYVFLSTMSPQTRRVTCSTWCPCLSDADWRLQSDVVPNLCLLTWA